MNKFINAMLAASTIDEVNEIVWQNIELLDENPRLYSFVHNARKRIYNLRRAKLSNWKQYELN